MKRIKDQPVSLSEKCSEMTESSKINQLKKKKKKTPLSNNKIQNKNNLKIDILEQLWKTCSEKHESIAIQIEQLLCDLVLHINQEKVFTSLFLG